MSVGDRVTVYFPSDKLGKTYKFSMDFFGFLHGKELLTNRNLEWEAFRLRNKKCFVM